MSALVWLHEDALRADHPVFKAAGPGAKAVHIWDADYLADQNYALKRQLFIYECLADLPVDVYVGGTLTLLRELGEGKTIFMPETPNPFFQDILSELRHDHDVQIISDHAFSDIPANTDLGRFFRFWNRARRSALKLG